MMFFIDWFNRVWKMFPNGIEAELAKEDPDHMVVIGLGREMAAALDGFEHCCWVASSSWARSSRRPTASCSRS